MTELVSVLLIFSQALAAQLHTLKRDKKAASGACLAPVKNTDQAKKILERNGVRVEEKAKKAQIISVAIGIQQIELLAGGPSEYISGAYYKFPKRRRFSRQTASAIEMGKNYTDGNVAHVMHELGHYVGNQGIYESYKENVEACEFTKYCTIHYSKTRYRNEEFAETWAAFITHPELLKNSKRKGCRQAFEFFAELFGEGSKFAVCNRKLLTKNVKQLEKQLAKE